MQNVRRISGIKSTQNLIKNRSFQQYINIHFIIFFFQKNVQ